MDTCVDTCTTTACLRFDSFIRFLSACFTRASEHAGCRSFRVWPGRCCDQSAIKTICNHFLLTDRPRRQISLPSGRFRSRLADGSLTWCISAVNFAGRFLMTNLLTAVHFCQSKFMSGIVVALRMRCCDLFWLACCCGLTPSIGDRA